MAIKIKKKDGSEEPEGTEEEAATQEASPAAARAQVAANADPLLKASWETASWLEENRYLVLGGVALVFVAIIGGYIGLQVLESNNVEASNALTPAFDSYSTLVEGSPEMEALKANPDIEVPEQTYENEKARWEAVYNDASKALEQHGQAEVALAAMLARAAAAIQLDKADEAIELYERYRQKAADDAMEMAVLQGLATAYASAERWDDALKTLDEIAALDENYALAAQYQKARVLERAGKADEAKSLYHSILDEEPNHPNKSDIERRLATM